MTKEAMERRTSYRCKVAPELSDATIECNRKKTKAVLLDISLGGFTIAIPPELINHFPGGELAKLYHQDEVWYVQISGCYREGTDAVHLGLRRVADATPMKVQSDPLGRNVPAYSVGFSTQGSMVPACLVVGLIILTISFPGIADLLGNSKSIQTSVKSMSAIFKKKFVPVASSPNVPFGTDIQTGATGDDRGPSSDQSDSTRKKPFDMTVPDLAQFFSNIPQPKKPNSKEAKVPGKNGGGTAPNRPKNRMKDNTNR